MAAANRIRPKDVFTDAEWATLSRRDNWRGLVLVAHAWGWIIAAFALFALFPNPLTFLLSVMITGSRQLGVSILMHEAAHGALHPNRKINDFLGHWLGAAPIGASLGQYRAYHLKHHQYVQQPEDPDLVLAAPFPVSRDSLKRKIIRDLTGQTFLRQRLGGFKALKTASGNDKGAAAKQAEVLSSKRAFRDHVIVNLVIFGVLALAGVWWIYPAIWLVAMATWLQLITRIRNIAEHACVPDSEDPLGHARTTHASWWERFFIAPYWVNYHSEHHAFMHLPCYRLPAAHRLLVEKGHSARIPQKRSYLGVLKEAASASTYSRTMA